MSLPAPAVLVVDDAYLVRWTVRNRLTTEGFCVLEAKDAADARALLTQGPSAVLLNATLNGANTLDLLAEFLTALPKVPVLVMLDPGAADLAERARAIGARGMLDKPLNLDKVCKWLRQLQGL